MRRALAIAHKELTLYFTTPWAWLVMTAMGFLSAYLFLNLVEEFQRAQQFAQEHGWSGVPADMRNVTDGIWVSLSELLMLLLLLLCPLLSMRLFAEERRNGTLELLLTCPLRLSDIVLGKFLGGISAVASLLAPTVLYPVGLSFLGASDSGPPIEWATVLCGYFGLLLLGATCVAVGMFLSSLTDSQMLAAVLTFSLLLPWTLLGWLAQSREEPLRSILNHLSFQSQLAGLLRGAVELSTLLYFPSVIFFFLFLTRYRLAFRWETPE